MANEVLFSVEDGGAAIITLNRPKALNSLSTDMLNPIREKLKEWEANDEIRLILLQGAGEKGFCAGVTSKHFIKHNPVKMHYKGLKTFSK